MQLVVIGLNHKTAPVEVREHFSLSRDTVLEGLRNLDEYEGIQEAVILSTCNRSEIYAVLEDGEADLRQFMSDITGHDEDIEEYTYTFYNEECIRHLLRVSSSLDSLIIGEGQILSQVKQAYSLAIEAGATDTVMNLLFNRAIATGKRVRTETRIAFSAVSVSYAAVELARKHYGDLSSAKVLILGAGKMAELTGRHLMARDVGEIFVANRHMEKAEALAEAFGGKAVPFREAIKRAMTVDIVVTSTGAPHYVVKSWETKQLMARRKDKPIMFIDIAVPRDVEPEVGDIKGVTLYNIDDLEEVVDEHKEERRQEAFQAESIVEEETQGLLDRYQYLYLRPVMAQLSERGERIRKRELRRVLPKLHDLSEDELKAIEHMSEMLVRKLLREPMRTLNASAGTLREQQCVDAAKLLFKLDTIPEVGADNEG